MSTSSVTLIARDLAVAAGPRPLVAGLDLLVAPGMRIGLVGPNGSGKSSLLRTLAGLHPAEAGEVRVTPPTATVGYLPQEVLGREGETVRALIARRTGVSAASAELEAATAALAREEAGAGDRYATALERWLALGAPDLEARTGAVAAGAGLPADLLDRPVGELSGGQRARAQLVALLLARYDVLLLDEPTNDLDLDGLAHLERFVLATTAPLVVVSHDRAFLERTVTGVAEIDAHSATVARYDGGWQAYLDERARARAHAEERYRAVAERRDTLAQRARTQRAWAARGVRRAQRSGEPDKSVRHRHIQRAEGRAAQARRTERAIERLDPVEKPWEGWDLRLSIARARRSGDVVARLDGAVVELAVDGTDDGPGGAGAPGRDGDPFVLGPIDLQIGWGERVAIVGPNGSGKTTLLHALLGRVPLATGGRWLGPGVVVGEIGQDRDPFAGGSRLLDAFQRDTGIAAPGEARTVLAKFGLGADHVTRQLSSLSPGERTRATLAVLQARQVNLLVLDEPTNHLDIPAIEQLEAAVASFTGTLVLVTHDRRLLSTVGIGRTIALDAGAVTTPA
ncbi:MAG: ABC-F family ATP-binding cassette domain-containing protein [Acidimicrobiia bacterium]